METNQKLKSFRPTPLVPGRGAKRARHHRSRPITPSLSAATQISLLAIGQPATPSPRAPIAASYTDNNFWVIFRIGLQHPFALPGLRRRLRPHLCLINVRVFVPPPTRAVDPPRHQRDPCDQPSSASARRGKSAASTLPSPASTEHNPHGGGFPSR
jgi:hypothetical protein